MNAAVLLLDDDEDLRPALADLIERSVHCGVLPLGSVDELQSRDADALHTQLAFLDINLGPDKPSGVDAYRWLKNHDYGGRIFFITGHGRSHPAVQAALQLGEAELLEKPVGVDRLIGHVKGALENADR